MVSSLILIPAVMIYKLFKTTGSIKERLDKLLVPDIEEKDRDINGLGTDPNTAGTNETAELITSSA